MCCLQYLPIREQSMLRASFFQINLFACKLRKCKSCGQQKLEQPGSVDSGTPYYTVLLFPNHKYIFIQPPAICRGFIRAHYEKDSAAVLVGGDGDFAYAITEMLEQQPRNVVFFSSFFQQFVSRLIFATGSQTTFILAVPSKAMGGGVSTNLIQLAGSPANVFEFGSDADIMKPLQESAESAAKSSRKVSQGVAQTTQQKRARHTGNSSKPLNRGKHEKVSLISSCHCFFCRIMIFD